MVSGSVSQHKNLKCLLVKPWADQSFVGECIGAKLEVSLLNLCMCIRECLYSNVDARISVCFRDFVSFFAHRIFQRPKTSVNTLEISK